MAKIVANADIQPDEFFFEGLGRQNMSFEHAVAELIDNSVAASALPTEIDIRIDDTGNGEVGVTVSDRGSGMSLDDFKNRVLKPGARPISAHRLNEHGFGLKNALCSLTRNELPFEISSRDTAALSSGHFYCIRGPFKVPMQIEEVEAVEWPSWASTGPGTIVSCNTTIKYIQTTQRKAGPRATNLATLTGYLREHLGVLYRRYLATLDPKAHRPLLVVTLHQGGIACPVEVLAIPMNMAKREEFMVSADGVNYTCTYVVGVLDEALSARTGFGMYYQGNIPTQGIDISLGYRTIATHQFSEIWPLSRHGSYNSFVGELYIPGDIPKGHLRTVNNKSNFDDQDELWGQIFDVLRANYEPPKESGARSEAEIRHRLADNLQKYTKDLVQERYKVWGGTGVEIDVYQESSTGEITIYEIKVGRAQPLFLYQLRMYWDGLTMDGKKPTKAFLVVAEYDPAHVNMAGQLCGFVDKQGRNYDFEIKRHGDFNLP